MSITIKERKETTKLERSLSMYEPYQSPPILEICLKHQLASRVGYLTSSELNLCPCCKMSINNK